MGVPICSCANVDFVTGLLRMATSVNGYQTSQGEDGLGSTASDVTPTKQVSNRKKIYARDGTRK